MAIVRKRNGKWQAQVRRAGHPARARSFATNPAPLCPPPTSLPRCYAVNDGLGVVDVMLE